MPRRIPQKPLLYLFLLAAFVIPALARDIIPAGTILQCTLDEPNFSAKTAMPGDPVLCHLGPLGTFGHNAFPRGAELGGHLEDSKSPGHFFGKGWISLEFDRLILPGAEIMPLASKIISAPHMHVDAQGDVHGKGHAKRDVAEWMIPILWPIKVATLANRGPYPAFKGETRLALRLMEDVEIPSALHSAVPMPPWVSPSSYNAPYNSAYPQASNLNASGAQHGPVITNAAYSSRDAAPRSGQEPGLTVIAMKDGSAFLAREYWVAGGALHCLSASGDEKNLPLEQIDLYQTSRVNHERHVEFVLQTEEQ